MNKRKIIGVTVGTNINPQKLSEYVEDGKSAYELAVEHGFKGTEQEWVASLNGKDGADGRDGYTPVKGVDYFDGADGYTPIKGVDYFDGTPGKDGKDGYTPVKGKDYFDGINGQDGVDGVGIEEIYFNDDDEMIISMTDGSVKNLGKVVADIDVTEIASNVIIDVVELPTANINTEAAYRLIYGTFVSNKLLKYSSTCHMVEWDSAPTGTGDSVLVPEEDGNFNYVGYYNVKNGVLYGYFDSATIELLKGVVDKSNLSSFLKGLAKAALSAMSTGWKTMQEILDAIKTYTDITYGGVITSMSQATNEKAVYLYLTHKMYSNINSVWVETNRSIGHPGTGDSAEIFNSLDNVASGDTSHAEGNLTYAAGVASHSEGMRTFASGLASHAEGSGSTLNVEEYTSLGDLMTDWNSAKFMRAVGKQSHAEGYNNIAWGDQSHAEGLATLATGLRSHTEGTETQARDVNSHAEGNATIAQGNSAHAEGIGSVAVGQSSHAEGAYTTSNGESSHSEGIRTVAEGRATHAEGKDTLASGNYAHAEGEFTVANGTHSHAEGLSSDNNTDDFGSLNDLLEVWTSKPFGRANGNQSHSEGSNTVAWGIQAHSEGYRTIAYGGQAHSEGQKTIANGEATHAEGKETCAKGENSHAEGLGTTAEGSSSHAEGVSTLTIGVAAHAEGSITRAEGEASHSEGRLTRAKGKYSHSEGYSETHKNISFSDVSILNNASTGLPEESQRTFSIAYEDYSHNEGINTVAWSKASHAEGRKTLASGIGSHAEGSLTTSSGHYSHAEGENTIAKGQGSHTEGISTRAEGHYSHTEGSLTTAYGRASHAEGSTTLTEGDNAHAEGLQTIASGAQSHAEGKNTEVVGDNAHASGLGTQAMYDEQFAAGRYNDCKSDTLFEIGNGYVDEHSDIVRSNAFEVYADGSARVYGSSDDPNAVVRNEDLEEALSNIQIDGNISPMVKVTYAELKSLRDNSELVPGVFYRITDYRCTTVQENTRAENHQFDIIVQALSNNTLSENAKADYHYNEDGSVDGYFQKIESNQVINIEWLYSLNTDCYGGFNGQFVEFDYDTNNFGIEVPTLYTSKEDPETGESVANYDDVWFLIDNYEFDGETYNRWRLIEAGDDPSVNHTWDSDSKKFILTNIIVQDNSFIISDADEIEVMYVIYDDDDRCYEGKGNHGDDIFVEATYGANNEGTIVPILYKTDPNISEEVDYDDPIYYIGRFEYGGEIYDRWRKVEGNDWDTDTSYYILTNIVVEDNRFMDGAVIEGGGEIIKYANIPAWEIKYCLDNDTTRFAWALDGQAIINLDSTCSRGSILTRQPLYDNCNPDENEYQFAWGVQADIDDGDPYNFVYSKNEIITNGEYVVCNGLEKAEVIRGTGIIYYMKDEYENECPYDFKNIQFKRMISLENGYPELDEENGEETWVYTFCGREYDMDNDAWSNLRDGSLESAYGHLNDEGLWAFSNNVIRSYIKYEISAYLAIGIIHLNNIVMLGYWHKPIIEHDRDTNYYYGCGFNSFGNNCHSITLGHRSSYNVFGNNCQSNILNYGCNSNRFDEGCSYNTFDCYCKNNTLGYNCASNIFNRTCEHNTFEEGCHRNTLGKNCCFNTFGNHCSFNTFNEGCESNIFRNSCQDNILGIECEANVFGNNCRNIIFGSDCNNITHFISNVQFGSSCSYISLFSTETGQHNNRIRYITISSGISGKYGEPLMLNVERNAPPVVYEAPGTTHIILD